MIDFKSLQIIPCQFINKQCVTFKCHPQKHENERPISFCLFFLTEIYE